MLTSKRGDRMVWLPGGKIQYIPCSPYRRSYVTKIWKESIDEKHDEKCDLINDDLM